MQRYKLLHSTNYQFSAGVFLDPQTLRIRPRGGADLRIESATLKIDPPATVRWHRDVEDNAVATATFDPSAKTDHLSIESEVVVEQYNLDPLDFLVADQAVNYPFAYTPEDRVVLSPYLNADESLKSTTLTEWVRELWKRGEEIETYALLERINKRIHENFEYQVREEPGVRTAEETLSLGSGSCRDFSNLFMEAARRLGLAARFVSGYRYLRDGLPGSPHAWAEFYLPGAGWKGFDPTEGELAGDRYIATAVSRLPEAVPPIEGSYTGKAKSTLKVGVWITKLK